MSLETNKSRLFIAIAVPEEVKARLSAAQQELRELLHWSSVSWTRPANLHLTLRFLGDVSDEQIPPLVSALTEAARPHRRLALRAVGLGCFPDVRRPRVLWAGMRDQQERLPAFVRDIVSATAGFTREVAEENFAGHVTLGRVRRLVRAEAARLVEFVEAQAEFGEWTCSEVELIRSELNPAGSIYSRLAVIPLAGG